MGLDISLYSVKSEPESGYKEYSVITDFVEVFEKYFGKNFIKIKTNQCYDFKAIGITEDCYNLLSFNCINGESTFEFQNFNDKQIVTIKASDIPLREKNDKVIYIQEIGYQRKGLNDLFYEKYTKDDYFVFTKNRLKFIYDNFVEEEYKKHFKEAILDKFEEGKTFVTFDW